MAKFKCYRRFIPEISAPRVYTMGWFKFELSYQTPHLRTMNARKLVLIM